MSTTRTLHHPAWLALHAAPRPRVAGFDLQSLVARALLCALVAALLLAPGIGSAAAARIPNGLGVVLDSDNMSRVAFAAPGQTVNAYIVTDMDAPAGLLASMRAYQFGLELDPRLELVGIDIPPEVNLPNFPAPDDYIFGLGTCMELDAGPRVLLTAYLRLKNDKVDTHDVRINVRALRDGREMQFSPCYDLGNLQRFQPAGGSVLNPTSPSIVRFAGAPPVVVEGRTLRLAWEAYGAQAVTLDGGPTDSTATLDLQPVADTQWTLAASANGTTVTQSWSAQVIRKPRVDTFTAELFGSDQPQMVALRWDVQGADEVLLDNAEPVPALGGKLVPLRNPPVWRLVATNEWGSTATLAGLDASQVPPLILSFTASPNPFHSGDTVTLAWDISNATEASIAPGIGAIQPTSGTLQVQPLSTTVYTLTASNPAGAVHLDLVVQFVPPGIRGFGANPNSILPGQSTTLHWDVENAQSLRIDPDVGEVTGDTGDVIVTPTHVVTTYRLTVTNPGGTIYAETAVTWKPPEATFSVSSATPFAIDPVTLTAMIAGAASASIAPQVGAIPATGGEFSVLVTVPTTFTLTAINAAGTTTRQLSVTPRKPTVTLTASATTPFPTDPVDLVAVIAGAASATLTPGFGDIPPTGGTFTTPVPTTTTFILTATNPAGSTAKQVTVTPRKPAVTFTVSSTHPYPDESITLTVSISGADGATLTPGFGAIPPTGGTFSTTVSSPTTFTLTATNTAGSTIALRTVSPKPPEILSFRGEPPLLGFGESGTLVWATAHATSVDIAPGGFTGLPPEGSLNISPVQTTLYTLTARNGSTVSTATTTVGVNAPFTIVSFAANPSQLTRGEGSTLSWEVAGVGVVSIDGIGGQPLVGSVVVYPIVSQSYVLRVQNGSFVSTAMATVTVFTTGVISGLLAPSWSGTEYPGERPQILPYAAFSFYVLAMNPPGGIQAYELSVNLPPNLIVSGGRILSNTGASDFGNGDDNFIIGTGGICLQGELLRLISYNGCLFLGPVPTDAVVWLGPSAPSSFPVPGGMSPPGYATCATNELRPFQVGPSLGLGITNPPTPALVLDLSAEASREAITLRWDLHGASGSSVQPAEIRLVRRSAGQSPVEVARFSGAQAMASGRWSDASARPATPYRYAALAVVDGATLASSEVVASLAGAQPALAYARLLPNVPNPFNPRTEIVFELARGGTARLAIFDAAGRQVRVVELPALEAGVHAWTWQGEDDGGRPVVSGVYRVRLLADGKATDARSLTLVR